MNTRTEAPALFRADILRNAIVASLAKLAPRTQLRNPVMFAVYLGSILTTLLWIRSLSAGTGESSLFILGVSLWLWATVLVDAGAKVQRGAGEKCSAVWMVM
jgi:K+-transporting ATPase ATPase B chain